MTQQQLKIDPSITRSERIENSFIQSLRGSSFRDQPYKHWLFEDVLPGDVATAISALPFPPPENMNFNGRRETNNSKRIYFNKENQDKFSICRDFVDAFNSDHLRDAIKKETDTDLSEAILRVEYCQDTGDFWLEPHTDISVKKFTMLVYLSDDPALSNCGTDVYDTSPEHKLVYSAPYKMNAGLLFIPSSDTWHGFSKRFINGIRKSLIINYVSSEWKDKWELVY